MKLIIGMGNPGPEYRNSRHNIGYMALDKLGRQEGLVFSFEKRFNSETAKSRINGKPIILAKPLTFVNNSGDAAGKLKRFYKIKPGNITVIHDDLDLDFGSFKMSLGKDSAGHRGVESIIQKLKTNKFWRLRIGTANRKLTAARKQKTLKAKRESVGGFVLSKFTPTEQKELNKILKKALERLQEVF